jgi:uncharacterized damage-inducible protein DinB
MPDPARPLAPVAYYAHLLRYDAWANRETLQSLRVGTAPARALKWMGHIVGAGTLWLARVREEPSPLAVWPELDLEECAAGIERMAEGWSHYLEALAPADLEEAVGYRNSAGEYWTSAVGDILTHLAMHGAYHRAQIAAAVREHGGAPAYTDFIHAVRRRLVE